MLTKLVGLVARLVGNYFERNPIGGVIAETGCRVTGNVVRRPDLSIFLGERWQQLDLRTVPVASAPDSPLRCSVH